MSDLISRQAAIEAIESLEHPLTVLETREALELVPSAHLEREKGKWYFEEYPDGFYHSECSICGGWFEESAFLKPFNFCPACGADMRG